LRHAIFYKDPGKQEACKNEFGADAPGLGIAWDFAAIERLAVPASNVTIQ
jgi:hypothetical protein